ncbi:MAG: YkgJ family cysteine cluster protein [Lentimicrobium sp.]|nr:YkgJ family cysteine cluster protein [Lentimicrobium sp.]
MALNRKVLKKTVQHLAKINPRDLDTIIHSLHEEAFSFYDCLKCANCCRSISPAISHNDVEQLAKKLKVKPSDLVVKYLHLDEEGDFVFQSAPCPFIDEENYCSVYSHRPKACREYPHTDRSRFYQLLNLSLKNAEICPVVYAILMKFQK